MKKITILFVVLLAIVAGTVSFWYLVKLDTSESIQPSAQFREMTEKEMKDILERVYNDPYIRAQRERDELRGIIEPSPIQNVNNGYYHNLSNSEKRILGDQKELIVLGRYYPYSYSSNSSVSSNGPGLFCLVEDKGIYVIQNSDGDMLAVRKKPPLILKNNCLNPLPKNLR